MGIVYSKGINNMPRGWTTENEKNFRIYHTWTNMLCRCYDEKYHERQSTYKECSVCKRWLFLSNFVEDFHKINGYNETKFLNGELCLDKDIKSNGQNKEYCLEQCMWVSKSENTKQSNKTMDYSFMQERTGENHPMYGRIGKNNPCSIKICQYDKETYELIKVWNSAMDIQRELNINNGSIIKCCKFWGMNCNKEEWYKTHKNYPNKSAGGFIWKYFEEEK